MEGGKIKSRKIAYVGNSPQSNKNSRMWSPPARPPARGGGGGSVVIQIFHLYAVGVDGHVWGLVAEQQEL
jgi:hypothetical protein